MSRTLRFGSIAATPRLASRIDTMVIRRRTISGFDRLESQAQADAYADMVAESLTPKTRKNFVFRDDAPGFGNRGR